MDAKMARDEKRSMIMAFVNEMQHLFSFMTLFIAMPYCAS
jgi:hypothetical protein